MDLCLVCTVGQLSAGWGDLHGTQGDVRKGKMAEPQLAVLAGSLIKEVELEGWKERNRFLVGNRNQDKAWVPDHWSEIGQSWGPHSGDGGQGFALRWGRSWIWRRKGFFWWLFCLLSMPCGMGDLNFPTRDWTCAPALEGEVITTRPPGKSEEGSFKGKNSWSGTNHGSPKVSVLVWEFLPLLWASSFLVFQMTGVN